jgi:hypothetical protein
MVMKIKIKRPNPVQVRKLVELRAKAVETAEADGYEAARRKGYRPHPLFSLAHKSFQQDGWLVLECDDDFGPFVWSIITQATGQKPPNPLQYWFNYPKSEPFLN